MLVERSLRRGTWLGSDRRPHHDGASPGTTLSQSSACLVAVQHFGMCTIRTQSTQCASPCRYRSSARVLPCDVGGETRAIPELDVVHPAGSALHEGSARCRRAHAPRRRRGRRAGGRATHRPQARAQGWPPRRRKHGVGEVCLVYSPASPSGLSVTAEGRIAPRERVQENTRDRASVVEITSSGEASLVTPC
jgi:hypothetical protein